VSVIRFLALLVSAVFLVGINPAGDTAEAAGKRPDIVVIYMDDFSPLATWLWSDPSRTPALAKFANQGVWFKNADGETSLCCPARVQVLTGRHGHNTGVTQNEMSKFNPRFTIGTKLQKKRYRTAYIGKYLNGLAGTVTTRSGMRKYSQGWNRFSVIWENQGRFYDYRYYRKSGTKHYGSRLREHSSNVAGVEAASFIRQTPKNKRLFTFVSLYDGHGPFTPMKQFVNHPKGRDVKDWQGPAFNEADVSDKPAYIRNMPRSGKSSYNLQTRCEEVMTVDSVVQRIRKALKDTGRLNNTLLIFTADNGWMMGDHRVIGKTYPYSTPVPLYMLWPAKWNNQKRV